MGLISLPIMLRYGYNRTIATGTITASGTLAQAIPPSLVLIVLADQMGRSVGDMYAGALIPGLLLVGLYMLFVAARGRAFDRPGCRRCRRRRASTAKTTVPAATGHCSRCCSSAGLAGLAWSPLPQQRHAGVARAHDAHHPATKW